MNFHPCIYIQQLSYWTCITVVHCVYVFFVLLWTIKLFTCWHAFHCLGSVFWASFSALTLLVGWSEGLWRPAPHNPKGSFLEQLVWEHPGRASGSPRFVRKMVVDRCWDWVKTNLHDKYLHQRSFHSKVIVRTLTDTRTGQHVSPGPPKWPINISLKLIDG